MEEYVQKIETVVRQLEASDRQRLNPSKVINSSVPDKDPDRILNEENFSPIGSGEDREVYELPDEKHVVKIDLFDQKQNVKEVERWIKAKEDKEIDESKVLVPIVEYDDEYKWVIHKRVDPISLTDDDWTKIDEQTDYDLLENLGVQDIDTLEFGWYDEEIVAYDYGQ